MRHRKYRFKTGRFSEHRQAMVANVVASLITHGRIETTVTKAKLARRLADRIVSLAKRGTLHARRQAIAHLGQREPVNYLFEELADRFEGRPGGFTRIHRLGQRRGDGSETALLELVTEPVQARATAEGSSEAEAVGAGGAGEEDRTNSNQGTAGNDTEEE